MLRVTLQLALIAVGMLLLANGAAQRVGGARPAQPGAAGVGVGCADGICFQGIVPGVTPLADTDALMTPLGYRVAEIQGGYMEFRAPPDSALCWTNGAYVDARYVTLSTPRCDVRLGDLLPFLGAPLGMSANCSGVRWYFRRAEVFFHDIPGDAPINPRTRPSGVMLWMEREGPGVANLRWHGYMTFNQYLALEPGMLFSCGAG